MSKTFEFNIPNGNEEALETVDQLMNDFDDKITDKHKAKKTDLTKFSVTFKDDQYRENFVSKIKEKYGIVGYD